MPKTKSHIASKCTVPSMVSFYESKFSVPLQSQKLRKLIRTAAANCAHKTVETRNLSQRAYLVFRERYRNAIFATITLNMACGENSRGLIFEEYDFEDMEFWPILVSGWEASCRSLTEGRKARIRRINQASLHCSVDVLRSGIEGIEKTLSLELEIAGAVYSNAESIGSVQSKRLIQTPVPWESVDPDLKLGSNGAFFGFDALHPTALNNTLVIGGTGSGKTKSVVIPIMNAMLDYLLPSNKRVSLLVIDPKRELTEVVRSKLAERGEIDRLVVIGETMPVPLFSTDSAMSMSDRLAKLEAFAPADHSSGNHTYWKNLGMGVLRDLMQLEWAFSEQTGGKRLSTLMCQELNIPDTANKGYWGQLRAILALSRLSKTRLKEVDTLLRSLCSYANVASTSLQVMSVYTGDEEMMRQWCYAVQSAEPMVNALANPDIARYVDLDPIQTDHSHHTDLPDLLEHGKVIVFSPEPTEGHRIAAKAIKLRVFESVFSRADQHRPIGIVVDEAQKFVTSDSESGEPAFLDRCRAYRCLVVLATQSIASLKHALGSNNTAQTAVDIVTANTPTKFVMRTTDVETVNWLKAQLPCRDGDPHIVDVRRPASLQPGEAYFLLANGTWGRKRARIVSSEAN